jgi:hypothetical protein
MGYGVKEVSPNSKILLFDQTGMYRILILRRLFFVTLKGYDP